VGNEDLNIPFTQKLDSGSSSFDQQYILGAYQYLVSHPVELFTRSSKQFIQFFGPLNGAGLPSGRGSTWHHGLDAKRLFLLASDESQLHVLYRLEIVGLLISFLIGISGVLYLKRKNEKLLIGMMLGPIVSFVSVHVISDGDARYRIPIMPFCFSLFVIGAVSISSRLSPGTTHNQEVN